jgi:hypothetical protein
MLLRLLVLSHFMVMDSFAVVVCSRFMVPGCVVVMLTGGVFY